MTTDQIKTFITETLLQLPEWRQEFVTGVFYETDEGAAEYMAAVQKKSSWKRGRKFKFSSWKDFVTKQAGGAPTWQLEADDIWPCDVAPYGSYPEDNKEYIARDFTSPSDLNGGRDISMYVITDATDENIVLVHATGD